MIQTLEIPSEYNIFEIVAEFGKPLNTSNAPFEFYYIDECGNTEIINITSYTFELKVYFNDCLYLDSTDLIIESPNKLYINIPTLNIKEGQYDYKIDLVGGNSVISGKLIVK